MRLLTMTKHYAAIIYWSRISGTIFLSFFLFICVHILWFKELIQCRYFGHLRVISAYPVGKHKIIVVFKDGVIDVHFRTEARCLVYIGITFWNRCVYILLRLRNWPLLVFHVHWSWSNSFNWNFIFAGRAILITLH